MFIQGEATIHYNKLQADPKQGKSLDIGITSISLRLSLRLGFVYFFSDCYVIFCQCTGSVNVYVLFQC